MAVAITAQLLLVQSCCSWNGIRWLRFRRMYIEFVVILMMHTFPHAFGVRHFVIERWRWHSNWLIERKLILLPHLVWLVPKALVFLAHVQVSSLKIEAWMWLHVRLRACWQVDTTYEVFLQPLILFQPGGLFLLQNGAKVVRSLAYDTETWQRVLLCHLQLLLLITYGHLILKGSNAVFILPRPLAIACGILIAININILFIGAEILSLLVRRLATLAVDIKFCGSRQETSPIVRH